MMSATDRDDEDDPADDGRRSGGAPREIPVGLILGGDREVVLIHRGERYRLRITANQKLILTK